MKKKTLALLGAAALVGVALASCSEKKKKVDDEKWEVGGQLDLWHVYSKSYGTTYNDVITDENASKTNPIDGKTYQKGDILPAWKTFAEKLKLSKIEQGASYGASDGDNYTAFKGAKESDGVYKDKNGNVTDLFYNTTAALNELGDDNQVIDIKEYLDKGKMPNLRKFLDANPAVEVDITHNGHIFYTPYLDGYEAIERLFVMDTVQVEKLLDDDLPTGTGLLAAGTTAAADSKGLKGAPQVQPFIHATKNYPDATTPIDIVNNSGSKVTVTVNQTDNIVAQQNASLTAGTTGGALIEQFKTYARAAYGNIIDTYYGGKISKMFTSGSACYNADDLVALLRIFKANPDVLYGDAGVYDEVVPVFPRGQADNRVENLLNFGATLYGVQGRGSEYDHLFFGADGKLHDFDTQTASYDMLDKLHALYQESIIQPNFWNGDKGTLGVDTYFKKTKDGTSTYGLLEYDYIATQSAGNEYKDGMGTKLTSRKKAKCGYNFNNTNDNYRGVKGILSPITYVSTSSYSSTQSLDSKEGKTLKRYYEENRSVKNTSWAVPSGSDNVASAITLMDYMFSEEGSKIQNFGPEGYWENGTIMGESSPIIKQEILDHFATTGLDFWNYCRGFLGTTHGFGHYRPVALDYQATNEYTRGSYADITTACKAGVQLYSNLESDTSKFTWNTTMVQAVFSTMSNDVANQYAGVSTFWAQKGKADKNGTTNGWVAIVANGSDYTGNVLTSVNGSNYTYAQVKSEINKKNTTYLYTLGETIGKIAPEARA